MAIDDLIGAFVLFGVGYMIYKKVAKDEDALESLKEGMKKPFSKDK